MFLSQSMAIKVWETGFVFLFVFGCLTCVEPARVSKLAFCPAIPIIDSILGFQDLCWDTCPLSDSNSGGDLVVATEGDDVSFQRVLNLVHSNHEGYISVLFHASWCPFSRTSIPNFAILSSLYPSIRHFGVEESAIRPRILSRYGIRGFPTLFLLNSTMRVRYHGSRTLNSLVTFYSDVTGIKPALLDQTSIKKVALKLARLENSKPENRPFTWARSPGNLFRQETYLSLATAFVLLRLFYFLFPSLLTHLHVAWIRHILNSSLACLDQATRVLSELRKPCKRSNLHEGAMNARAWASKSLASVSIENASSSMVCFGK